MPGYLPQDEMAVRYRSTALDLSRSKVLITDFGTLNWPQFGRLNWPPLSDGSAYPVFSSQDRKGDGQETQGGTV